MRRFNVLQSLAVLFLFSQIAWGSVPQLINFQGVLKTPADTVVSDGSYSVTFTIYDAATGGNNLWTETQSVTTTDGLFAVFLGASNPIPDSAFKDADRYLGIAVSPDGEMPQRQRLVSVGYSYRVNSVDSASGGTITSKVSIGQGHINTGAYAFVAGESNTVSGHYATVAGGAYNTASGFAATVGGGGFDNYAPYGNNAGGDAATVGGGLGNYASGYGATVSGGVSNLASGGASYIGGGFDNTASSGDATVVCGSSNIADDTASTVGGGVNNRARGKYSVVAGGGGALPPDSNAALGDWSAVPGGLRNVAAGNFSFAAGRQAKALNDGAFVWADNSGVDFASTGTNQFLIRATGGTGIGTASPAYHLDVQSPVNVVARLRSPDNHSYTLFEHTGLGARTWAIHTGAGGGTGKFAIADLSGGTNPFVIDESGRIGIGTASPTDKLTVVGNICATGFIGACSDARFKRDIEPIEGSLDRIEKLQGVTYRWNRDEYPEFAEGNQIGFVAQKVREILPEVVSEGGDGTLSVDYGRFSVVLLEAIKEQQKEIKELRAAIEKLRVERK